MSVHASGLLHEVSKINNNKNKKRVDELSEFFVTFCVMVARVIFGLFCVLAQCVQHTAMAMYYNRQHTSLYVCL